MKILAGALLAFVSTMIAVAIGIFYVFILVFRIAWLGTKIQEFWKQRKRIRTPNQARDFPYNVGPQTI